MLELSFVVENNSLFNRQLVSQIHPVPLVILDGDYGSTSIVDLST